MTNENKQPQSIFPDYPREQPMVDKEGRIGALWDLGLSSLFQALQMNFKNEGIVLPPLTTTQISTIQGLYTPYIGNPLPSSLPDITGQTILDSTNRVPKVFIITYDSSTPPNITAASWKTYTIT